MSFRFKQFTVADEDCAMKVGTDAVLLGAWAEVGQATNILDIGTGSGVIALMLAQRAPESCITGIDIEPSAARQADFNFRQSPWADRLTACGISLQDFVSVTPQSYDLIVSNPPYFRNGLKAPDDQRNSARHTDLLSYEELLSCAVRLLRSEGTLAFILPVSEELAFVEMAKHNALFPWRICRVRGRAGKPFKRVLISFRQTVGNVWEEELTLEDGPNVRSMVYRALTADYYL